MPPDLLPLFNMSYSVGKLHQYSVDFYHELERETEQTVGFSVVSNIRLAATEDRMDEYRYYAGVAQTVGVEVNFLTPEQVKEAWPMCNTDGLIGAIQHPDDGYIQPADLTQALAQGAPAHAVPRSIATQRCSSSSSSLTTAGLLRPTRAILHCQHVVSCTGNFARKDRRDGRFGYSGDSGGAPVHCHRSPSRYPRPQGRRLARAGRASRESDAGYYLREEAGGMILGPYEEGAPCCYVDGPSAAVRV